RLAEALRLGDEAGRVLGRQGVCSVAGLHVHRLLRRAVGREEQDSAELVDGPTADVIAAPAGAAQPRSMLAAAVAEPLNAVDGYEVLERAPDYREPGAVEDITQGETAVRPKREEKGEEYEHSSAQIAEELRKRHRTYRGPEDKGQSNN